MSCREIKLRATKRCSCWSQSSHHQTLVCVQTCTVELVVKDESVTVTVARLSPALPSCLSNLPPALLCPASSSLIMFPDASFFSLVSCVCRLLLAFSIRLLMRLASHKSKLLP